MLWFIQGVTLVLVTHIVINGGKMMDTDLKQRQELCKDLEYLVTIDKSLREEIIDHFVYTLNDNEVKDYEVLVGSILGDD